MNICETCGASFEPKRHTRNGRYCSGECYYARGPDGPRKASVKRPRRVMAKTHPLADSHGRVALARLNLYEKVGPGTHPCNWCGRELIWKFGIFPDAIVTDHLDWNNTNDDPENLVVSCHSCNARRAAPGRRTAIQPDELTIPAGKYRTRAIKLVCPRCSREFLRPLRKPTEFCSARCANWTPELEAVRRRYGFDDSRKGIE